jgi:hypothetical protein
MSYKNPSSVYALLPRPVKNLSDQEKQISFAFIYVGLVSLMWEPAGEMQGDGDESQWPGGPSARD